MSRAAKVSDYCVVDGQTHLATLQGRRDPAALVMRALLLAQRRLYLTGLPGRIWHLLGIHRFEKNPNLCNS
ncbi:MAG: hypothetical protein HY689_11195 [Chloroflexi bacterium]|nr:hypothetical protein [Chloroflexota bacterium]